MNTKITKYLNCRESRSFKETLFSFIDNCGLSDSEVYKKANIDRKLFSKIRCGKNYIPRKNVIIKLGLALDLPKSDFEKLFLQPVSFCPKAAFLHSACIAGVDIV